MAVISAPLGNISRVTFQIFTTLGIIFLLEAEMEYFTFYDLVKYKRFWRNFFLTYLSTLLCIGLIIWESNKSWSNPIFRKLFYVKRFKSTGTPKVFFWEIIFVNWLIAIIVKYFIFLLVKPYWYLLISHLNNFILIIHKQWLRFQHIFDKRGIIIIKRNVQIQQRIGPYQYI